MILEVLLKSDGCSHHDGELNVVHRTVAMVGSEVFFDGFFRNPADADGKAGKRCSTENSFDEFVV